MQFIAYYNQAENLAKIAKGDALIPVTTSAAKIVTAILGATNYGRDSDSIATMGGAIAGALRCGRGAGGLAGDGGPRVAAGPRRQPARPWPRLAADDLRGRRGRLRRTPVGDGCTPDQRHPAVGGGRLRKDQGRGSLSVAAADEATFAARRSAMDALRTSATPPSAEVA